MRHSLALALNGALEIQTNCLEETKVLLHAERLRTKSNCGKSFSDDQSSQTHRPCVQKKWKRLIDHRAKAFIQLSNFLLIPSENTLT